MEVALPRGWDTGRAGVLANVHCCKCIGLGWRQGRYRPEICNCVWRAIFRACFGRYRGDREAQQSARTTCALHWLGGSRGRRRWNWSRPAEEYFADFELIARRTLDETHFAVFRLHFVEGLSWRACCHELRMDRGHFFHSVYRVEQQLGKAYSATEPYPLFPTSRYFGAVQSDVMVM